MPRARMCSVWLVSSTTSSTLARVGLTRAAGLPRAAGSAGGVAVPISALAVLTFVLD